MTMSRKLLALLLGAVLGCAAVPAAAVPTVMITGVGTRDAGGALQMGTSVNLGNNRSLLITGYLADVGPKDIGRNARVILESAVDQSQWSVPFVNRLWGAKLALQGATGKLDPAVASALNDAGFLAAADAYTLPPGTYNVKSVVAIFGAASTLTLPVSESMSITIPDGRTTTSLALTNESGTTVPFTPKVVPSTGDIRLSGYGIQRSGTYRLTAPAFDKWGRAAGTTSEFALDYQRPLVKFDVANPQADGFQGFPQSFSITNPLTNEKLTGSVTVEASIEQVGTPPAKASLNGTQVTGTNAVTVSLPEVVGTVGGGAAYSASAASDGAGGKVRAFVQRPDAPDLQFVIANWNPDGGISVAPTKPSFAVGVETANVAAVRLSGSHCGTVYDAPASGISPLIKFGANTVYCAVRWVDKPAGLNSIAPSPNLAGKLATVGTHTGTYETGVLWMHPTTQQVNFSASGTRTVNVVAALPTAPTINFIPDPTLVRTGATNPLAYAGTSLPGGVSISAPYSGLGVRIITDGGAPVASSTTTNRYYRPLSLAGSLVGVQRSVNIETYYTAAPDVTYTKNLTFDVVPRRQMLNILPTGTVVSTTPLTITGKFGSPQMDGSYSYDAATQGQWSVQLATVDGRGTLTNVGSPITSIGSDGTLTFDVGLLTPGIRTFTAVATQTDAAAGTTVKVRSRNMAVNVRNGAAIPVASQTRPALGNGPSPFTVQVGVWPLTRDRFPDVGVISYEVSDDGVTYRPLLKTDGSPMAAPMMFFIAQTLTGNVTAFYRVTVKNRWSGIETVADPSQVQAFVVPTIGIQAPRYTFIEHPITVTAVIPPEIDPGSLIYKWTVMYSRYDKAPVVTETSVPTLTVNPTKSLPDLIIQLDAKDAGAPDNPRATRHAQVAVVVLPPVLAAPTISGPTVVETGQSYTWSALQRSPFPTGTVTDLTIESRWVLPDGTFSIENPVTYVYKEGDTPKVRYESWVNGFPSSNTGTDLVLRPWSYEWPAWKMIASVINPYAPARVQFGASLVVPSLLASLHGEPISYTWTLPASAVLVSEKPGVVVADFPQTGTYQASVTIADTRGNSTTVDSQSFSVLPPKPLAFNFTLASADRFNRPPGPILARTVATSVPAGDLVRGVTFFVDGVQAGPEVLSGANFSMPSPGTYTVRAVMSTVKNVTAESTQSITLTPGDNPVCNIVKNGDGVTLLWFAAQCSVQRGTIVRYHWKVNGQDTQVNATTFRQTAGFIASTQSVEVTATTDGGQTGGALFNMSTNTSTPVN